MKKILVWLVDYYYMLKGTVAMVIFRKPPKHHLGHVVRGKCPIVVLPGIMGSWSFMRPIVNKLSLDGHPIYVVPKLKNNLLEIPLSAKIVENLIKKYKIKDAVLVAHSKGGLVGKYFLTHNNENNDVLGMVSLATPYAGSEMAKFVPHDAFLELLPEVHVISELVEHERTNKKIISISPSYDNHVWHKNGSFLEGAKENIEVDVKGHHKIIFDREVAEIVLKSVKKFKKSKK